MQLQVLLKRQAKTTQVRDQDETSIKVEAPHAIVRHVHSTLLGVSAQCPTRVAQTMKSRKPHITGNPFTLWRQHQDPHLT